MSCNQTSSHHYKINFDCNFSDITQVGSLDAFDHVLYANLGMWALSPGGAFPPSTLAQETATLASSDATEACAEFNPSDFEFHETTGKLLGHDTTNLASKKANALKRATSGVISATSDTIRTLSKRAENGIVEDDDDDAELPECAYRQRVERTTMAPTVAC